MSYNCKPSPKYILHLYSVPSKSEWRACFDFGDFNGGQLYILGAVYRKELPTKIIEQNQQQSNRIYLCPVLDETWIRRREVFEKVETIYIIIISLSPCAV